MDTRKPDPEQKDSDVEDQMRLPNVDVVKAILGFYLKIKNIPPKCDSKDIDSSIIRNITDIVTLMNFADNAQNDIAKWRDIQEMVFNFIQTEIRLINGKDNSLLGLGSLFRQMKANATQVEKDLYLKTLIALFSYLRMHLYPIFVQQYEIPKKLESISKLETQIIQDMTNSVNYDVIAGNIIKRRKLLFQLMRLGCDQAAVIARHSNISMDVNKNEILLHEYNGLDDKDVQKFKPQFFATNYHIIFFQKIILIRDPANLGERTFDDFETNAPTRRKPMIPEISGMPAPDINPTPIDKGDAKRSTTPSIETPKPTATTTTVFTTLGAQITQQLSSPSASKKKKSKTKSNTATTSTPAAVSTVNLKTPDASERSGSPRPNS